MALAFLCVVVFVTWMPFDQPPKAHLALTQSFLGDLWGAGDRFLLPFLTSFESLCQRRKKTQTTTRQKRNRTRHLFFSPVSQDNNSNNNTTKTAEAPASFVLGSWGGFCPLTNPQRKKTRRRRREGRSMVMMMVLCVRGCGKRRRRRVERF